MDLLKKSYWRILKMKNKHELKLIGKKFGSLEVISLVSPKSKWGKKQCLCKCECGKEKVIRQTHLIKKIRKSCGCRRYNFGNKNPGWKGYGEISASYFLKIKGHAKNKNHKFDITCEDIWKLFLKQKRKCALTNLDLNFQSSTTTWDGTASLDRIDSSKGYTIDNVQWVHKDINSMKRDFTEKQLFEYCKLICINKKLL